MMRAIRSVSLAMLTGAPMSTILFTWSPCCTAMAAVGEPKEWAMIP